MVCLSMHQKLKDHLEKIVSLAKFLGAVAWIMSIKNHFKGDFGLNGFLDPAFLCIEDIWHSVQKGSGYILS